MKNKKIADALGEIDPKYIAEAAAGAKKPKWVRFTAAAAAILAVVLLVLVPGVRQDATLSTNPTVQGTQPADLGGPVEIPSPITLNLANLVAGAEYPQMVAKPNYDAYENKDTYYTDLAAWQQDQLQQYDQPSGYADSLEAFWRSSLTQFLSGQADNAAYSPVNVYMALAMLAETTGGNSRQQILELLGLDSIEALRTQASLLWNAHYANDGATTTILANSVWLDSSFSYKQATVNDLVNTYFASVFHGDLGTGEMNEQLRAWINSQTGGLLEDQTQSLELDPATLMTLVSTIYFSADWEDGFSETNTAESIFHAKDTDIRTQFMNKFISCGTYYWGEDFGAVRLSLSGGNAMWLILPDEGKTVDDVLASGEYLQMCMSRWKNQKRYDIRLSLPKFDISSKMDLSDGLQQLGVTDVFHDKVSDFSGITEDVLTVGKIDHAVRVAVDEEGCVAAAYTVMQFYGTAAPADQEDLDFILDRPFLFVITSRDRLPLFAGVVNQP